MHLIRHFLIFVAAGLLCRTDISAQTALPIVQHVFPDTMMFNTTASCFFEFRNESGSSVSIRFVNSSTEMIGQTDYSKEPILPGSTAHVGYTIRGVHCGPQDLPVRLYLSNDSVITLHARLYIPCPANKISQQALIPIVDTTTVAPPTKPCDCNVGVPVYHLGNNMFVDSVIALTTKQIKPSKNGTIYVRFTIDENGDLVNPEIIKSVDPKFEAKLLANMPNMGKWTPACQYTSLPESPCPGSGAISVVLQLPFKIMVAN